ncbi:MAG: TetR/AcrR family transcriptional regulator [Planctomycetaceae bacterium]|nr:TetR/AcrR family transcriptional regulator [Planctomycetaceae bacterium]
MPRLTDIRKQALDEMMKEAFFEATVAVLNEHGVEGMTMDRVAAAAGVAKGSLYRYFRGKRDLLEFVFTKVVDPIFQAFEELAAKQQPAIELLSGHLEALLEHVAKHARVHRLLFEDDAAHGLLQPSERRTSEAAGRQMATVFQQGIEEGVFRPQDPLLLAHMYLGLTKGVLQSRPPLDEPEHRKDVHRLIIGTFLSGIATDKGRVAFDG